jgi:subtilisin family serine protease
MSTLTHRIVAGVLLLFCVSPALAADAKAKRALPHRVILKPKAGITEEQFEKLRGNRRVLKKLESSGKLTVLELDPAEDLAPTVERMKASGLVEFAEPDYPLRASIVPNDPHFASGLQWPLRNSSAGKDIHAVDAWDVQRSASSIIVAVVDSGIRYTHEDLAANMWRNADEIPGNGVDDDGNGVIDDIYGINAITGSGNPMDDADHGTHVAGIIGAVGNNGRGIAGVAWNVKLMACKFLDSDGFGFTSDAVEAVDYARKMGAQVINGSFGGEDYSDALFTAIQNARAAGIIFVTAAGNEQLNIDVTPMYPAAYSLDNIVVVGGSTRTDQFDSTYSNYGASRVDLFAPGTSVYSTWGSSDTAYLSETGTSMASPHVAGAVALMKARFTGYSSSQIISRLLATVDTLPDFTGRCRSNGRLNLARALGTDPMANFTASKWVGEPPLAVNFANTSLGGVSTYQWDFGDGTESSTSAQASHVFTRDGDYNVRLTVVGTNGQSSSLTQVVRVASNYQFATEPYAWVTPTAMPRLSLADNGVSAAQALPFEFEFYGVKRSTIYVGANGLLGFSPEGLENIDNVTMPNAAAPNGIIAPFWDNLDPSAATGAGTIYVGTIGTAPNRRFVVSWVNVERPANPSLLNSFQAILEEKGGIVFQYRTVEAGRSATVGIENFAGDAAALYSFNGSPTILASSTAVRASKKLFRYLLVNKSSLSFSPATGASSIALGLENGGNQSLNWRVSSTSPWISVGTAQGTLSGGQKTDVAISLSAEGLALPAGTHEATLTIANTSDNRGNVTLPVTIRLEGGVGVLEFTPPATNLFTGGFGGPFQPSGYLVELRNSGGAALDWNAAADAPWIEATPSSGTLNPGESLNVQVALSSAAQTLAPGLHTGQIEFRNLSVAVAAPLIQPLQAQVNAHVVTSSAKIRDGAFQGQMSAPTTGDFAVEYSEDLLNWNLLEVRSSTDGSISFSDSDVSQGRRFYRLRSL